MPWRRQRAEYQQLTHKDQDRILEMLDLHLLMRTIAVLIEYDMSTIQCYVIYWTQHHVRTRRKGSGSYECTTEHTDWQTGSSHHIISESARHYSRVCLIWWQELDGLSGICIHPNHPKQITWGKVACTTTKHCGFVKHPRLAWRRCYRN